MFTEIRRKRQNTRERTRRPVTGRRRVWISAMAGVNGFGYGIPISYVLDNDGHIYFHCAQEGYKLECLKLNPKVSFLRGGENAGYSGSNSLQPMSRR